MSKDQNVPKPKTKYLAEEFSALSDLMIKCAKKLANACKSLDNPGALPPLIQAVFDAETEADVVRDRLLASFYRERHPPPLQMDRVEMLRLIDRVCNKCEHATRQLELAGEFFPAAEYHSLEELADIVVEATERVGKAVKVVFESFEEARSLISEVENLRDKARNLVVTTQARILQSEGTTFKHLYASDNICARVQQVTERCKQVADLIETLDLKYL